MSFPPYPVLLANLFLTDSLQRVGGSIAGQRPASGAAENQPLRWQTEARSSLFDSYWQRIESFGSFGTVGGTEQYFHLQWVTSGWGLCICSFRVWLLLTACGVAVAAQSQSISLLQSQLTQRSNISSGMFIGECVSPLAVCVSNCFKKNYPLPCFITVALWSAMEAQLHSTEGRLEQLQNSTAGELHRPAQKKHKLALASSVNSLNCSKHVNIYCFSLFTLQICYFNVLSTFFSNQFHLPSFLTSLCCSYANLFSVRIIRLFYSFWFDSILYDWFFLFRPADCGASVVALQEHQSAEYQGNGVL